MRVLVAIACLLLAACNKPVSITFAQKTPIVLDDDRGVSVPGILALNKSGEPLQEAPPVQITAEPAGIVTVDNGKILPVKNGDAKLKASAEGLPAAELPIHVAVIDDIRVACAQPCALHVGENLVLDAVATGLGDKITTGIEWASSDATKASVDQQGKVAGVAAGTVTITAKLGKKATETKLEVHPAVDELRLLCPWPPLVVDLKRGDTPPAGERSCEVLEGEDVQLEAVTVSHGDVVTGERIEWRSSDPSVRVVGGTITGDHPGGSMVEIHAADLVAEMPVSVVSAGMHGLGNGHCSASDGALTNRFDIALKLKNATGETQDEVRSYRCEQTAAKKALDDAAAEVGRAVEKLAFDMKSASTFGENALDERARRCCCKH